MESDRVLTGVGEFDSIIGGGFQRRSLVLVAGRLGTGKTIFASQFVYCGVTEHGENGIYVSFAEDRETYYRNMLRLGFDFEKLEKEGKFRFLDMVTVKEEGIFPTIEMITDTIETLKVKRLVIDSFSAMAQAFREPTDIRIVLHTILYKMVRQTGCTTLILTEIPTGVERLGSGMEEFVADGALILRRSRFDDRDIREVEIAKLRGTEVGQSRYLFSLHGGFRVFPPFRAKKVENPQPFKPIPDSKTHFSSGNTQLDDVLGGGYERGSYILIDISENVPYEAYRTLIRPTVFNFLTQGRGVTQFLSSGVNPEAVRREYSASLGEDVINRLLRFYVKKTRGITRSEPWYVEYKGASLEEDFALRGSAKQRLAESTGQPVLSIWGIDDYEATYGTEIGAVLSRSVAEDTIRGNLTIDVCKPVVKDVQRFRDLADYHFKLGVVDGGVIVYLAKPATGVYCLEDDVSKGYHEARLTPMV